VGGVGIFDGFRCVGEIRGVVHLEKNAACQVQGFSLNMGAEGGGGWPSRKGNSYPSDPCRGSPGTIVGN